MSDCIIIGGGPAGMMAGYAAALQGHRAVILEKNKTLGKKLLITGKGRCNVTNAAGTAEFMDHIPTNPKFLYSAFRALSNDDLMKKIEEFGTPLKVERGGRVFPQSDHSADILRALQNMLRSAGVHQCQGEARHLLIAQGKITGVELSDGKKFRADNVVLATGGISYPRTGSTGDGYRMAKEAGHSITKLEPSLVPIETKEEWPSRMQGLSLKNVTLSLWQGNKCVFSELGEMLFTHFGLSGPLVLSASSHMKAAHMDTYRIELDCKPGLDDAALEKRLLRDFQENQNKDFINALSALLPLKLIPVVVDLSGISPRKKVHQITKAERGRFCTVLKHLSFTPKCFRPIEEAIVTSGGVQVKEVSPSTLESKLVRGLYFAGEILDVDAYTGGYNLQIAFSTGFLAGNSLS